MKKPRGRDVTPIPLLCECEALCNCCKQKICCNRAGIYEFTTEDGPVLVHYKCAEPEIKAFIDAYERGAKK